jgi:hypothetical protein
VFADHVLSELIAGHTHARQEFFEKNPEVTACTVAGNLSGWNVFFASKKAADDTNDISMLDASTEWASLSAT